MDQTQFYMLLERYITATASPDEEKLFLEAIELPAWRGLLEQRITEDLKNHTYNDVEDPEVRRRLFSFLERYTLEGKGEAAGLLHFTRYVAAAILLLAAICTGLHLLMKQPPANEPAGNGVVHARFKNDIPPGHENAILALADGSRIDLDSAANGSLGTQGGSRIIKLNGQLSYQSRNHSSKGILYNRIITARGNQYELVLADGTRVWLNANSSLRFPTAFAGDERRVELTGEAYFEVAPHSTQPFKVSVNDMEVRVLGTDFNINAYSDESSVATTLLRGAVNVMEDRQSMLLRPGQQLQLRTGGQATVVNDADTDQVVAWKNGLFDFESDNLTSIMRQLSRWYDIDVEFKNGAGVKTYTGAIRRQVDISKVLNMLELAGGVEFGIEGRKVTVRTK